MISKALKKNRRIKVKRCNTRINLVYKMNTRLKSEKASIAEYYESRRRFLIKVAEARRKVREPEKKTNPLTLCPVEEY